MINIGRFKNRLGEVNYNKLGSKMIIIKFNSSIDIDIYFPEYNWIAKNRGVSKFDKGEVKCPYEPRHYNKGCIGEGEYKPIENKKIYKTWQSMLQRCYDLKYHEKQPTYIGCEVCDEWLNFQNFARWYYDNYYEIDGERMELDKDILIKGNKVYSPQTCVFVPQCINSLFTKRDNCRGNLPIGVSPYGENKFIASLGVNKSKVKSIFNTSHEAFLMYKLNKELLIQGIANEYKDKIPNELYEAMIKYEVEIDD